MKNPVTRLDSCQYLLVSQINDTLTHFADHCEPCSHDAITRSLRGERSTPRLVWEHVRGQVVLPAHGDVRCDDPGLDKHASCAIALVRRQDSGNAQAVSKGLGVVPCVSVHPDTDQGWRMDSLIDDPDGEGKSTREHVREMRITVVSHKPLPCQAVLMDTWEATKALMGCMESLPKGSSCPRKDNRQGEEAGGERASQRVDALAWSAHALAHGKRIKITGFHKDYTVQLCRVEVSPHRTDDVVTNDHAQDATEATQEVCGFRWQIAPLHREGTPGTGLARCQCRTARLQRQQIGWAFLVWVRRTALTVQTGRTVYQLKHGLLDDSLIQQLRDPSLRMVLA